MSWFNFWTQAPLPPARDLAGLSGSDLADEHARTEIEKMRVEILDERSWRTKLFLSLIIPVGGALAFINTWMNDRSSDRQHRNDQLYSDAAKELSNTADPSVRQNAIETLDQFVEDRSWLSKRRHECAPVDDLRSKQSVALIMGHLSLEQDTNVLRSIASAVEAKPCQYIPQLLSVDRTAAASFARAAGNFGGLYTLARHRAKSIGGDDHEIAALRDAAILDIEVITLRTGSPFEAENRLNNKFASRTFFSTGCPYVGLFENQMRLTMSSGLPLALLASPPKLPAVVSAEQAMEQSAVVLEKASNVLASIANTETGMEELREATAGTDLYGVAIVVGEIGDAAKVAELQKKGAYVQQFGVDGVCTLPSMPSGK